MNQIKNIKKDLHQMVNITKQKISIAEIVTKLKQQGVNAQICKRPEPCK